MLSRRSWRGKSQRRCEGRWHSPRDTCCGVSKPELVHPSLHLGVAMSGVVMSKDLKKSLPQEQQEDVEELLWLKSGGKCFLCGAVMNRAVDILEVDHDQPSAEGGADVLDNLNVVHRMCNRFKRNHPSVNVRPYLKFEAYVAEKGGDVKYDGAAGYFAEAPGKVVAEIVGGTSVRFEFPDKTDRTVPIYTDMVAGKPVVYTFVDVPRSAIINDDECQPRTIKLGHLWSILSDLQINPLHEPPACRLREFPDGSRQPMLMFDGQHKTVASWLKGEDRIVAKVYLGMEAKGAIVLVNSIQSKIKKLPLSPFEFNAKLSDEWEQKVAEYEGAVGSFEASEEGFLKWIADPAERKRGNEAFKAALIDGVVSHPTLELRRFVAKPGGKKLVDSGIPEATLKSKVLQQLLHLKPLAQKGEAMRQLRERELKNIVRLLNVFTAAALEVGPNPSPQAEERAKRMKYQASLQYAAMLMQRLVAQVMAEESPDRVFTEREPDATQWEVIENGIQRMVDHPIWTVDLNSSAKTKAVADALSKNQNVEDAFRNVNLRLGHLMGDAAKASDLI